MSGYGDPIWEELFSKQPWGKYPSEEVIRFFFSASRKLSGRRLKVLDLGCGMGAVSWFLRHEGADVVAMDGAPSGLARVPVLAGEFGIVDGVTTILGDITRPQEYVTPAFDLIIDHYSICANPKRRIREAYRQIKNLLAPGGFLFTCGFGYNTDGYDSGTEEEPGYYRNLTVGIMAGRGGNSFFSAEELRAVLTDAGMRIEYEEQISHLRNGFKTEKLIFCAGV